MYRVFNMGIGMVLVLDAAQALDLCKQENDYRVIGEVVEGEGTVKWG
jgi:phosphoribosylaminoimidazole (AIR) synthetase